MADDQRSDSPPPLTLAEEVADLRLVGWTHRTSPLRLLEQVAVPRAARPGLLGRLREAGHPEAVVLSTCSRTEVYLRSARRGPEDLASTLAASPCAPRGALDPGLACSGPEVADHLFRVAAGLDSRVLGEVEIRGQVRTALGDAHAAGAAGPALTRLFAAALRSASRVQQQTGLGAHGRSMARQAVDLGLAELDRSTAPFVLIVGAGRMARTAVEHLARHGLRAHVAARDTAQAARLVGEHRTWPLTALQVGMTHADLVVCATSASSYVVTGPQVRRALRSRSTLLTIVDLSVPRNVDSSVGTVPGVRLLDLTRMQDDASQDPVVVRALGEAQDLVGRELRGYLADTSSRAAAPVITEMRRRVEQLCLAELRRKGLPELDDARAVALARALTGRLLHGPTMVAREAACHGDDALLQQLAALFTATSRSDVPEPRRHADLTVTQPARTQTLTQA